LADIGSDKYLHLIVGMMVAAIMRLHLGYCQHWQL